jgi:hypothetical protein
MSDRISVSKDGGIEPHLIQCEECGCDYAVSVGVIYQADFYKAKASKPRTIMCDRDARHKTRMDLEKQGWYMQGGWEHIPTDQRYIKAGLCADCEQAREQAMEKVDEIMNEGGALFRCLECSRTGAMPYNEDTRGTIDGLRKEFNVAPDKPLCIEFDKCEQHGGAPLGSENDDATIH